MYFCHLKGHICDQDPNTFVADALRHIWAWSELSPQNCFQKMSKTSKLLPKLSQNCFQKWAKPCHSLIAQLDWFAYLWFLYLSIKSMKDIAEQAYVTVSFFLCIFKIQYLFQCRSRMPKTVNHTKMLEFFQSPEGYQNRYKGYKDTNYQSIDRTARTLSS